MTRHVIYTIGHSNRPLEEFIGLLKGHAIKELIDVRTIPMSRHNPQFNKKDLARKLRSRGIGYRHIAALGGLRKTRMESFNLGWNNLSFRGFADYMSTPDFLEAKIKLENSAARKNTVIMCAEALPWRCHRSLIADALIKDGWRVFNITSLKKARQHKLTPFLRMIKGKIAYSKDKNTMNIKKEDTNV